MRRAYGNVMWLQHLLEECKHVYVCSFSFESDRHIFNNAAENINYLDNQMKKDCESVVEK